MVNQFGKSHPVTLLRACATRRIDCVYPRPSFRARHACYAGCVEAGDKSKESVQEIIESIRLLFTLENDDFGAVSQCKGAKLRRADLESGLSYIGY